MTLSDLEVERYSRQLVLPEWSGEAQERLDVLLDAGEPLASVPRSAREDGHDVTLDGHRVTIVKR